MNRSLAPLVGHAFHPAQLVSMPTVSIDKRCNPPPPLEEFADQRWSELQGGGNWRGVAGAKSLARKFSNLTNGMRNGQGWRLVSVSQRHDRASLQQQRQLYCPYQQSSRARFTFFAPHRSFTSKCMMPKHDRSASSDEISLTFRSATINRLEASTLNFDEALVRPDSMCIKCRYGTPDGCVAHSLLK